jgi:Holliday junction resolvase RusA-like endonuclease
MLKIQKEYIKEYGNIKDNYSDRLNYLLKDMKLKNKNVYDEIKRISNIKWNKLSYTIYLVPKGTPRPRSGKNGVFYVKGASDNKKIFKEFIRDNDITLISTPTKFHCISYLPIPSSMSNVEKILAELGFIRPTSKPDWDNIAKAYCDMIQGILLYDDSLVVEGSSKKFYSVKPRIEILIEYMENYDCKFNRKKILMKGK